MVEVKSGVWVSATLPINAGDEYKFRANKDWTVNIGREGQDGSNFKTEFTGPCLITLDFNNKTVTCAERNEDVWAVIGNFDGTAWDTDFPMAEVEPGVWQSMPAGDEGL